MRAFRAAAAMALLLASAGCLARFELVLHCSQTTSFWIAVADLEPHPEEGLDGRAIPAVYSRPWAYPLRAYLAAGVLVALLMPVVVALRGHSLRPALFVIVASTLLPSLNGLVLGDSIAGERFVWLGFASTLFGVALSVVSLGTVAAARGWRTTRCS